MARPRKASKFDDLFSSLSVEELKQLKADTSKEIKRQENEIKRNERKLKKQKEDELKKEKSKEIARKNRDKIRIGSKISYNKTGADGGTIKAEVIGIFAEKVQIEVDGRKRSIALEKIISVN